METATPPHLRAVSAFGHALSDHTRARILMLLRDGPSFPSDIAVSLGVSRQVVSNQLACLRGCGLVHATRVGRQTSYDLADPALDRALGEIFGLLLTIDPDCCSAEGCSCA